MAKTVIKVENLYKEYRLGVINHGTLVKDLQSCWARLLGKTDPNSKIDANNNNNDNNSHLALKNLSFEVKQGEILGIIGLNGAGKSTLLKILSRVTGCSSGQICIKGRIASLLEVGTGFHPELTGRQNIYLNGAILGMSKKEIALKFDEIYYFSEIGRYIDTPVKRYSSGMKVRLAFAVAAHLEAEILIVDEVLAVGDTQFQKKCLGKMKDVTGHGRTVLFVSHNMGAIRNLCSRCILLKDGQIALEGDTENVILHYLKQNFIKSKIGQISASDNLYYPSKVEILKVVFKDLEDNIVNAMEILKEYILEIFLNLREFSKNYRFTLKITNSYGEVIVVYANDNNNICFLNQAPFTGKALLRIKFMNLLSPGDYNATIKIKKDKHLINRVENISYQVTDILCTGGTVKKGIFQQKANYELAEYREA